MLYRFWLTRKTNAQGQLARRVFLWQFAKQVPADSHLKSNILENIPAVIMKAVLAFKALVKDAHLAGLDVTDFVAERTSYFQDVLKEMDDSMNLRKFLGTCQSLACHPEASISVTDLIALYKQWCTDRSHKPQQWNADNVADALGHLETKCRTNRAGNQWGETFQILPKNDVGCTAPGGFEHFYWGVGLTAQVAAMYDDGQMPADNPMHHTSRQLQQRAVNREATQMAADVTARNNARRSRRASERAGRGAPAEPVSDAHMATRFLQD